MDNLKFVLTIVVIFCHSANKYIPWLGWPVRPVNNADYLPDLWRFNNSCAFLMQTFYFISGFFFEKSFFENFSLSLWKNRMLRLSLPLMILVSIMSLFSHHIEYAHMWYVEMLLIFMAVYALLHHFTSWKLNTYVPITLRNLFLMSLLLGTISLCVSFKYPINLWVYWFKIIYFEPVHVLKYAAMFVWGILAYRNNRDIVINKNCGVIAFLTGVILILVMYLFPGTHEEMLYTKWFAYYCTFLSVFFSIGLIYIFKQYGNIQNRFFKWCSILSYGVYLVHLPIVVGVQLVIFGWIKSSIIEFFFVSIVSTILSFLFTWVIRYVPIIKRYL